MLSKTIAAVAAAALLALAGGVAHAQYLTRHVISLAEAKKMAAAAEAEAVKNGWRMSIVVVDRDGVPIYVQRMDDSAAGSLEGATEKAKTAALFLRPTKAMEDTVAGTKDMPGRPSMLKLFPLPLQGGLPVKVGDEFVGGIGCGGGSSQQDEQTCAAGIAAQTK
jgi:uncharacterized protein GlcG (DUF336 family)